jgi:dTDP-4-amino-4,6-dideoxygalactose transaminase
MIPLFNLAAQYQRVREEVRRAVDHALENTQYILGPEVAAFEDEFAAYCGSRYGVGVNSGTSALHLALLAAGVGPGDEVITVPFTFVATTAAIRYTGATPVFVDVEPESLTMDVRRIEAAVTPSTKAILPVHLYGQAADMDAIIAIAERHNLTVIEDCAQAHGATYKGKRVGSFGQFGCFSFYPSKNLGACGEGGLIVTSDEASMTTLRMLRDWGQRQKNNHELKGFNARLEGIQGAILRVKLRYLEEWTEERRAHARYYNQGLAGAPLIAPREMGSNRHVYHLYVIRTPLRDALQQLLLEKGVQTGLHYPVAVHLQPAHADLGFKRGDFPVSEQAANTVLSLPMFPELTAEQLRIVVESVHKSMEEIGGRALGVTK